jgi:hypothetical protein
MLAATLPRRAEREAEIAEIRLLGRGRRRFPALFHLPALTFAAQFAPDRKRTYRIVRRHHRGAFRRGHAGHGNRQAGTQRRGIRRGVIHRDSATATARFSRCARGAGRNTFQLIDSRSTELAE